MSEHTTEAVLTSGHANDARPYLPFVEQLLQYDKHDCGAAAPNYDECVAIWQRYSMPAHIQQHSIQVAHIVSTLTEISLQQGAKISPSANLAGALLHDIGKIYSVEHGCSHAQLGSAWVLSCTKNYKIAQMVYHHVHWPWEINIDNDKMLGPLLLIYADKRVMHEKVVSIQDRFEDLLVRYGHTEHSRAMIKLSMEQGLEIEQALSRRLGVAVDECSFDCGQLV